MKMTRMTPFVVGAFAFAVMGCQEAPTSPEVDEALAILGPNFSMGNGHGAVVVINCFAEKGSVIPTIVPVSETDWYFTTAKAVSSNCRTQPSGKHTESITQRVLGDIPLPKKTHRGSLTDENGDQRLFDIIFPDGFFGSPDGFPDVLEDIPIGFEFDAAPNDGTNDCDFTTTPFGMHSVVCRFDGS